MNDKEKELTGGELTDIPNDKYKKFFAKFDEIKTLPTQNWKPIHLIGYFCSKFQETFDTKYSFKFNSPSPSKCFEVFQIKKLASILSSKPQILKDYIDWIFEEKVGIDGKKFRSISFLTKEDIVGEYKMKMLSKPKMDRTTPLPDDIKKCFAEYLNGGDLMSIRTYGDLAFCNQALRNSNNDEAKLWIKCLEKAKELGLDVSILETIK